jgi:hypothetical protein
VDTAHPLPTAISSLCILLPRPTVRRRRISRRLTLVIRIRILTPRREREWEGGMVRRAGRIARLTVLGIIVERRVGTRNCWLRSWPRRGTYPVHPPRTPVLIVLVEVG